MLLCFERATLSLSFFLEQTSPRLMVLFSGSVLLGDLWPDIRFKKCAPAVTVAHGGEYAGQSVLQNTPSTIPAGIGRTRREIRPALKVPFMPKVWVRRVARCAIGAS